MVTSDPNRYGRANIREIGVGLQVVVDCGGTCCDDTAVSGSCDEMKRATLATNGVHNARRAARGSPSRPYMKRTFSRMKARTFLAAATAAIFYRYPGATAQAVNDTVITYPGAGVQWNSSDLFHNIVWDVDKIPPGYLEGANLELQHESFATPMNLASNVNVTQCHKLIPVPTVNHSDTYQVILVVNYPVHAITSSSSVENASETGIGTPVAITASAASPTAADASATTPDDPSSTPITPSNSAFEEGMQGMRRRHAMPNPYPYPDAASVTTVTSLTTVTTTVQASGAGSSAPASEASAALSSAKSALSSASLAMSSASAALASVSADMSASSPTSDLAPESTDTSDSETDATDAASYDGPASATTSLDGSGMPSSTSSVPSGALDGQEDGTPAYAPSSTGTAAQTTSTSFVGAYFAIHQNTVSASAAATASL
ncbi:hypothetical protein OH76DRAFT_514560 [Lentinus brumalis]|uniref:Uncharacterized protein n=1 Tax=Lentinus brumalis TaxID=2498619 RepID=A0A371DBA2_9APHY|nr:hypothetical protein OH76DRAFT_514560 [Polyporus brumalis]